MILEDILSDLRGVEKAKKKVTKSLAGQAADAIEMLVEKNRYLEEKLKERAAGQ